MVYKKGKIELTLRRSKAARRSLVPNKMATPARRMYTPRGGSVPIISACQKKRQVDLNKKRNVYRPGRRG